MCLEDEEAGDVVMTMGWLGMLAMVMDSQLRPGSAPGPGTRACRATGSERPWAGSRASGAAASPSLSLALRVLRKGARKTRIGSEIPRREPPRDLRPSGRLMPR